MIRGLPVLTAALLGLAAGAAQADLYLWKDPATGQVRIYSYPPPWYGNQELEKRAPRVERIPERQRAPAGEPEPATAVPAAKPRPPQPGAPPPASEVAPSLAPALLAPLEAHRRRLLAEMAEMRGRKDPGLPQKLQAYQGLVAQMDRIDPAGAETRGAEARAYIEPSR